MPSVVTGYNPDGTLKTEQRAELPPMFGMMGPKGEAAQLQMFASTSRTRMPPDIAAEMGTCFSCLQPYDHTTDPIMISLFMILHDDGSCHAEWRHVCRGCEEIPEEAARTVERHYEAKHYHFIAESSSRQR